jgi:hypothetical protein
MKFEEKPIPEPLTIWGLARTWPFTSNPDQGVKAWKDYKPGISSQLWEKIRHYVYGSGMNEFIELLRRVVEVDEDTVMLLRAFERALDGKRAGDPLVNRIRNIRRGTPAIPFRNHPGEVRTKSLGDSLLEDTNREVKTAILTGDSKYLRDLANAVDRALPTRPKADKGFVICLAFAALCERDERLPNVNKVHSYIVECLGARYRINENTVWKTRESLGLKFGKGTWSKLKRKSWQQRQAKRAKRQVNTCAERDYVERLYWGDDAKPVNADRRSGDFMLIEKEKALGIDTE